MSLYFWKVERKTGYCKIFKREKQADGSWKQIYCRSLGKAETHHKKLLEMEIWSQHQIMGDQTKEKP